MLRRITFALSLLGLALVAGCRYQGIWTGAEFTEDGHVIRLAAAEPLCGCLKITNVSRQPVRLRSQMRASELGRLDLAAGASATEQFDWAGPEENEVFRLDAWSQQGQALKMQDVIRIDDTGWPWHACGRLQQPQPSDRLTTSCDDGSLKLQTGRAGLWSGR